MAIGANLTLIYDCEATSNWSGESVSTNTDVVRHGNSSLAWTKVSQEVVLSEYDYYTANGNTYLDFNPSTHIYFWINVANAAGLDDTAGGGIRFRCTDDSSNYVEWWIGGNDNYNGGWRCWVIDTANTSMIGASSGTVNWDQIQYVGISIKMDAKTTANAPNVWFDISRYGSGLTIDEGTSGTPLEFSDVYDGDDTNAYGVVRREGGVYFLQGPIEFGDSTGTNDLYFEDTNQVIVFEDAPVSSTHYSISVVGHSSSTSSVVLGDSAGSGDGMIGYDGCTFRCAGSQTWEFDVSDNDLDVLKLYGCVFADGGNLYFGSTTTALGSSGSVIHLIDNLFTGAAQLTRNISSDATEVQIRIKTVGFSSSTASVVIADDLDVDAFRLSVLNQNGFDSIDDGVTQTIEVLDHDFTNLSRWIYVRDDKTWDMVNPVGTLTTGDQTDITFETDDLNQVNHKYSLDIVCQEPSGAKLQNAYTYVYEGYKSQDLPSANRQATDASGEASSNVLTNIYTDNAGTSLDTDPRADFALKVYKYTYTPFVTSLDATAAMEAVVTLLEDTAISETDSATAISNGSGITVNYETYPATLIEFTSGSGTLSVTDTVTGDSSSASGVVVAFEEGDDTAGTILLKTRNATDFTDGEGLTRSGGGWTGTHTSGSSQDFSWYVDCNSYSGQITYDYLAAQMAASSPSATFIDAIEWGEEQQTQLVYSGSGGYYTLRARRIFLAVDDCDETTGWSAGTDSVVSQNTTTYREGDAALNIYKTGTSGTTCSASKTTTSQTFGSFVGAWVYAKDSTFLAKLPSSNAVEIRFGNDSSNYYYARFDKDALTAGVWVLLNFKSEGASSSGSPSTSACDYTEVIYNVNSSSDTTSAGDFIVDDIGVYDPEGVFLTNRGAGTFDSFTADDGSTYTVPASVTLEVNGLKTDAIQITHGAVSGDDNAFAVPNYLRGTSSGASGKILEVVDGTHTIVYEISGTFSDSETINETTDGTAGGDTGDSATASALTTEYVQCTIESSTEVLMLESASTGYGAEGYYKATEPYTYVGDVSVTIKARYKSWLPFKTTGTVTSSGLTVTAVWIRDPNFTPY